MGYRKPLGLAAVAAVALSAAFVSPATASQVFGSGSIACLTSSALDEAMQAVSNNDKQQWKAIFDAHLCFLVQGREFSLVRRHFYSAEVRVYAGGDLVVLWTTIDAVK